MKILLTMALMALSTGAKADCVAGALNGVQLSDGRWLEVTAREGDKVTTGFGGYGGKKTDVAWQGVIPLVSDNGQSLIEWNWSTPLPDLAGLAVGESLSLSGEKLFNGEPDVRVDWVIWVEGEGTDSIAGCDYPVRMIRMRENIDGRPRGEMVYHLHAESGLVLGLATKSLFTGEETVDMPLAVK